MSVVYYLLGSISLGSFAQIVLRIGSLNNLIFLILCGLFMYFISALLWIKVLSKINVSIAYPFGSLGYVFSAFLGWLILGENLNFLRIIGMCVILIGVYLLSKWRTK